MEDDAGEVSAGALRWRTKGVRHGPGQGELVEQAAPVQRFDRWHRQAANAEGQLLELRVRIGLAFQHQHGSAGEREFAGEEQTDGAGAGDEDVT